MNVQRGRRAMACCLVAAGMLWAGTGWAQSSSTGTSDPCSSTAQSDAPEASISNGLVHAVVYLPDAEHGYYRSVRFDWAGVIPCLSYKGHDYFGDWSPHHDPHVVDSITGPVEEFRSEDGGLNYSAAGPDGLFVKPGVGVLRKVNDAPYHYMFPYPLVDGGKWSVHEKRSQISFTQRLHSTVGYSYVYTKTLRLEKGKPVMVIEHRLKNTGSKTMDLDVYDHDFFRLDHAPTGPGMVIHFAFTPKPEKPLEHGADVAGKDIVYHDELAPRQTVTSMLTGYSNNASDYDFTLENRNTGVGVEQSGDRPISNFNLWSVRTTVCPEAYVHLHIPPGKTETWDIRYRFFAR